MSDSGGMVSVEHSGMTVQSNTGSSKADITASLDQSSAKTVSDKKEPEKDEKKGPTASEIGKKGGEAAAAVRAAKARAEARAAKESKGTDAPEKGDEAALKSDAKAQGEADGAEADEAEQKPEKPLGKPRGDPRARMLDATRKEAAAKRELAEERRAKADLERRLSELERGTKPAEGKDRPQDRPIPDGKPKAEDFEDYEAYLDARDQWNRERWTTEQAVHRQARERETQLSERVNGFLSKIDEASADVPDFKEIVSPEVLSLRPTFNLDLGRERPSAENWIADELILSPEQAPAVMLHLTENPDEFQRLATLGSPREVTRAMARLAASLEAATTGDSSEPELEVSRAKPPVRPVTGKPYASESEGYRPGMTLDEYAKAWNKRRRA